MSFKDPLWLLGQITAARYFITNGGISPTTHERGWHPTINPMFDAFVSAIVTNTDVL